MEVEAVKGVRKRGKSPIKVIETSSTFMVVGDEYEEVNGADVRNNMIVDKPTEDVNKIQEEDQISQMIVDGQLNLEKDSSAGVQGATKGSQGEVPSIQNKSFSLNMSYSSQKGHKRIDFSKMSAPKPPDARLASGKVLDGHQKVSALNRVRMDNNPEIKKKHGGAIKSKLGHTLKQLVDKNDLCIVVLMETRTRREINSKLMSRIGFDKATVEEAIGFSGGIWVLWDSKKVRVQLIGQSRQFIHMKVSIGDCYSFLCTVVYANPNEDIRNAMWEEVIQMSRSIIEPWILAGDFIDIRCSSEKKGGSPPDIAKCRRFQDFLGSCNIEDVGGMGNKFTWQGPKWNHLDRVFNKLDRVCANVNWRISFEDAEVQALPRFLSDHNPILLSLTKRQHNWIDRPFRFLATWMDHPNFEDLMMDRWRDNSDVNSMLSRFTPHLKKWNREVFFKELFSEEDSDCRWLDSESMWPKLSQQNLQALGAISNDYEIRQNIFSMGAYKAPDIDGYPAIFFQRQWNRLKHLMEKIISPFQVSFVPNRKIQDNITIVLKLTHFMSKMRGKKAFMAIKIDLVKAYDRVSWQFMQDFCPSRGLRQGDPLSPYLFVLAIKKLSHIITTAVNGGLWKPMYAGKGGPMILHLAFADDLMMFMEAKEDQIATLMKYLKLFEDMSCQRLSMDKTCVYFSKNTVADVMDKVIAEKFYLGDKDNVRRHHAISWNVITSPKLSGG
ncbi:uncharacterized protein LOC133300618 [Gastrolobium bilobum]|uniref:uncharacterized protein LOC133300618 n=1 Tax=Gastrolobium bilobum TaxID=150636 RepID=UPI002AAF7D48|nr:uncharacterized protein LOC133300618 [Gastrolobium bilobum]